MIDPEERKAQYRASYYRNAEVNRAKARERARLKRANHVETPEEAEARRVYNRSRYAERYGPAMKAEREKARQEADSELAALVPIAEPSRTQFEMIAIGLLAAKLAAAYAYRKQWKREHYIPHPQPPKPPKPPKVQKPLQTHEERLAYKRNYEKQKLIKAKSDPQELAHVRSKRLAAHRRWMERMKESDPGRFSNYHKEQNRKTVERRKKDSRHAEYMRAYTKKRLLEDPQFRLAAYFRNRINSALRATNAHKRTRSFMLIGCPVAQLAKHIESQFLPGMSWSNWGIGKDKWSIDHIRPCASFDLQDEAQQRACFHFSNLRPMWFNENCSKGALHDGRHWSHSDHTCQTQP